uniref:Zinc finger CCCH domain-containing protein 14 n=1 Tax=Neolamprologus brichardi TaxID=32507 RepID=A0A3Q4HVL5_NEOBR
MVMVANKKTSQQMADDLSLFLGNNTMKFTSWLHGVLEKLRSVAAGKPGCVEYISALFNQQWEVCLFYEHVRLRSLALLMFLFFSEPASLKQLQSDSATGSSRLSSSVRPLVEPLPSEAVLDIKPEMDDDLIADEPLEISTNHSRTHGAANRHSADIYRPGQGQFTSVSSAEASFHARQQGSRTSRTSRTGSNKQEEFSRKRKAPVVSSVVRVNRDADEDSDDVDEDESSYSGRGLSSRVSLPSKPERKPTLPPAKQANRNLILKAISEAQDSITKTTTYPTIPQKQTVPVAPRTRLASSEEMSAAIQLVQEHLHSLAPRVQTYTATDLPPSRTSAPTRSLASRLQLENEMMDIDMAEENAVPLKKQKVMERCKFWPVCKSGDECLYHHPTTQCKTFPNCKFGDKCLFVHPNCKYDARCTKPDCPFTHVSRRTCVGLRKRAESLNTQPTSICRFFPECKKMDCPFYHPKPCRFAAMCKRAGCTFYHPTTTVPPRHALKWTKAQSR